MQQPSLSTVTDHVDEPVVGDAWVGALCVSFNNYSFLLLKFSQRFQVPEVAFLLFYISILYNETCLSNKNHKYFDVFFVFNLLLQIFSSSTLFVAIKRVEDVKMVVEMTSGFEISNEHYLWLFSVIFGILMCNAVYRVTGLISLTCFSGYKKLTKLKKMEWNNRGFSTFHAFVVAIGSFYLLLLSDLFGETDHDVSIIKRKSVLSDTMLGISIGYFLSDLGMILWYFPVLGGLEYVLHHALSMFSIIFSLISGQGQIYILMVLFSESTTPFVNLRWYLDAAEQKNSKLYICNGVALFLGWLVARILLFIFFFVHMYLHFDEVKGIFPFGFYSLLVVPPMLAVLNLFWFWKIVKGLIKTLSKARHAQ